MRLRQKRGRRRILQTCQRFVPPFCFAQASGANGDENGALHPDGEPVEPGAVAKAVAAPLHPHGEPVEPRGWPLRCRCLAQAGTASPPATGIHHPRQILAPHGSLYQSPSPHPPLSCPHCCSTQTPVGRRNFRGRSRGGAGRYPYGAALEAGRASCVLAASGPSNLRAGPCGPHTLGLAKTGPCEFVPDTVRKDRFIDMTPAGNGSGERTGLRRTQGDG